MNANENVVSDQQLELIVLEGRKLGARVALQYDRVTTVGVGYDCDVVLDLPDMYQASSQPGGDSSDEADPIVELLHAEGQLGLRVMQGSIEVDDEIIDSGVELLLSVGASVTVRNNVFTVQPLTQHESYLPAKFDQGAERPDSLRQDHASPAVLAAPKPQSKRILAGAMQSIAGVLVLGGSFWVYTNVETPDPVTINDVVSGVETDLETGGFSELNVVLQEDNTIAVNGYLQNRADLHKAREQVQVPDYVQWDVKLGDSLAESVGSVYRVNGVDAKVSVLGEGAVSVNTATNDLDLLQRVEDRVYQDVADLRELNLVNEKPVVEVKEPTPKRIDDLPGKRIVMIVASAPKYIQTEDGSRYFEGSILPSGHLVVAILDEKVQLKLDEKQLDLSY